jgi:hypothetical protein
MPTKELSQERLKEVLSYDAETGVFVWIAQTASRIKIGTVAGTLSEFGYRRIKIDGVKYMAHRLAWLWHTGAFPEDQLDHINGVPGDDMLANLRAATRSQNQGNVRAKSKLGLLKGVTIDRRAKHKRYMARISHRHIGYFETEQEAHDAYMAEAVKVFGEFARDH